MKSLILLTALIFSSTAWSYSDEAVLDAESMVALIKDRFAVGEVTRTDVNQAEQFLLEIKFLAGKIPKELYCFGIVRISEQIVAVLTEEEAVGMRNVEDVLRAKMEMHRVKALCQ